MLCRVNWKMMLISSSLSFSSLLAVGKAFNQMQEMPSDSVQFGKSCSIAIGCVRQINVDKTTPRPLQKKHFISIVMRPF